MGAKVCLEPSQKTGRMLVIALTAVARIPRDRRGQHPASQIRNLVGTTTSAAQTTVSALFAVLHLRTHHHQDRRDRLANVSPTTSSVQRITSVVRSFVTTGSAWHKEAAVINVSPTTSSVQPITSVARSCVTKEYAYNQAANVSPTTSSVRPITSVVRSFVTTGSAWHREAHQVKRSEFRPRSV